MRAVRFHEYGDSSVLRYEEVKLPVPHAGQVRIRVAATSFNRMDSNIRAGYLQGSIPVTLPHTLGIDVSGTIDALGAGVTEFKPGERVIGFLPMSDDGAAAEYVLARTGILTPAPRTIALADAAALPLAGLTAWQALFEHAKLSVGQRILINGAGGSVGGHAVQLAKRAGAYVIGVAGPRRSKAVRTLGADEIIDHTKGDVIAAVTEPVDVALNLAPVQPAQLAALIGLVRPGGTLVSTTVWMRAPSDKERDVRGIDLLVRSDAGQLAGLVALVDQGHLRVEVAERIKLADLRPLHARADAGGLTGKTIVAPLA